MEFNLQDLAANSVGSGCRTGCSRCSSWCDGVEMRFLQLAEQAATQRAFRCQGCEAGDRPAVIAGADEGGVPGHAGQLTNRHLHPCRPLQVWAFANMGVNPGSDLLQVRQEGVLVPSERKQGLEAGWEVADSTNAAGAAGAGHFYVRASGHLAPCPASSSPHPGTPPPPRALHRTLRGPRSSACLSFRRRCGAELAPRWRGVQSSER